MRTTVTLADDVAAAVDDLRRRDHVGVSEAVNQLVRVGLATTAARQAFSQTSSPMGVPALPIDDVAGLLDAIEGDDRRA